VRPALAAVALAAALVAGGASASPRPIGLGPAQVWILRPAGKPRAVVVFLHGWRAVEPALYGAWIAHLRARGDVVVFPRYQPGGAMDGPFAAVDGLRDGLRVAFARLPHGLPVVAVGHSFGAALVFYYAALARSWRLPRPAAVLSVFPSPMIVGRPLTAPPPRDVRTLILVGDRDQVVGSVGAYDFWRWLVRTPLAPRDVRVVRSTGSFSADHFSAQQSSPAARAAFWAPLDDLVARAR
jgi:pimeloyl-ACP methyl ester carboxylesterase